MNYGPVPASCYLADTSVSCFPGVEEPFISDGGSPVNSTSVPSVPISGEGSTTQENDGKNGEDGDSCSPLQTFGTATQHLLASGAPTSTGTRPRAPPTYHRCQKPGGELTLAPSPRHQFLKVMSCGDELLQKNRGPSRTKSPLLRQS